MKTRPRTPYIMKFKSRRCAKCGGALNNQRKRCKRCHKAVVKHKK